MRPVLHRVSGRTAAAVTRVALAGGLLLAAACSAASASPSYAPGDACTPHNDPDMGAICDGTGQIVDVTVKNFAIDLPATIPTGAVTFRIHGGGPTLHEFNVARSSLAPDKLPLNTDDTVHDTDNTAQFTWVAQIEGIDVGDTKDLTVNITPGHYVFYCNMDGHYMAGMDAQATAS